MATSLPCGRAPCAPARDVRVGERDAGAVERLEQRAARDLQRERGIRSYLVHSIFHTKLFHTISI
jgi:hypothetical protein